LERLKSEIGDINQNVYEWGSKLNDKYEALANFQTTRPHTPPSGDFALENRSQPTNQSDDGSLKQLEQKVIDASEQINHLFLKTEKDAQFLVQTLQELQDVVNKVYDKYSALYDEM
jgi:hypothetical protein